MVTTPFCFQHPKFIRCFLVGSISLCLISLGASWGCESRWIEARMDCGRVLRLDDGSVWELKSYETSQAKQWHEGDKVHVCNRTKRIRNLEKNHASQWLHVGHIKDYEEKDAACERPKR